MKSSYPQTSVDQPAPQSLRRSARFFKFPDDRDDLHLGTETVRVFTTSSPLLTGKSTDVGIYGAPVGVLIGYQTVTDAQGRQSVRACEGTEAFVMGRVVELTIPELAAMDRVAEYSGALYHRFKADIKLQQAGGTLEGVWVYQLFDDATTVEISTSAITPDIAGAAKVLAEQTA